MEIAEILKAPFKGQLTNSKLKLNESITINLILGSILAIAVILCSKVLVSDYTSGIDMMGIDSIIQRMLIRAFIIITINFAAIVLVFSCITYILGRVVFNSNISYEECASVCTYTNIIPTVIMLIGVIFSLFSIVLSAIILIIQILVLITLTYEGLSSLLIIGKSKLIYSTAITYIVNAALFAAINYLVIESMIKSSLRNLF